MLLLAHDQQRSFVASASQGPASFFFISPICSGESSYSGLQSRVCWSFVFVNAVTFVYAAFVPHCGKWKEGYIKALKVDSAIFYFKMGKKIIKKVDLVVLFTRREAQVRVTQRILRISRQHVQRSQAKFVVFTACKLMSPF